MASSATASNCSKMLSWRFIQMTIYVLALAVAGSTKTLTLATYAPVDESPLQPPAGNELLANYQGTGVQTYKCVKDSTSGNLTWVHYGARSTLTANDSYTISHYFLNQPDALGGRPTFSIFSSDPEDTDVNSTVTGLVETSVPSQVNPEANVPWLLLLASSHSGPGPLGDVSYIQRVNTEGGVIPAASRSGCTQPGKLKEVPYVATYNFFRQSPLGPTINIPADIVPPAEYKRVWSTFAQGTIQYQRDAKMPDKWFLLNSEADLSILPGTVSLGDHLEDGTGDNKWIFYEGQLWWDIHGKAVATAAVDPRGVVWTLYNVTSSVPYASGFNATLANATLAYVQRVSTRGGLLPAAPPKNSSVVEVPYTAIYWFYA